MGDKVWRESGWSFCCLDGSISRWDSSCSYGCRWRGSMRLGELVEEDTSTCLSFLCFLYCRTILPPILSRSTPFWLYFFSPEKKVIKSDEDESFYQNVIVQFTVPVVSSQLLTSLLEVPQWDIVEVPSSLSTFCVKLATDNPCDLTIALLTFTLFPLPLLRSSASSFGSVCSIVIAPWLARDRNQEKTNKAKEKRGKKRQWKEKERDNEEEWKDGQTKKEQKETTQGKAEQAKEQTDKRTQEGTKKRPKRSKAGRLRMEKREREGTKWKKPAVFLSFFLFPAFTLSSTSSVVKLSSMPASSSSSPSFFSPSVFLVLGCVLMTESLRYFLTLLLELPASNPAIDRIRQDIFDRRKEMEFANTTDTFAKYAKLNRVINQMQKEEARLGIFFCFQFSQCSTSSCLWLWVCLRSSFWAFCTLGCHATNVPLSPCCSAVPLDSGLDSSHFAESKLALSFLSFPSSLYATAWFWLIGGQSRSSHFLLSLAHPRGSPSYCWPGFHSIRLILRFQPPWLLLMCVVSWCGCWCVSLSVALLWSALFRQCTHGDSVLGSSRLLRNSQIGSVQPCDAEQDRSFSPAYSPASSAETNDRQEERRRRRSNRQIETNEN